MTGVLVNTVVITWQACGLNTLVITWQACGLETLYNIVNCYANPGTWESNYYYYNAKTFSIHMRISNAEASVSNAEASVSNAEANVCNAEASVCNAEASASNAEASDNHFILLFFLRRRWAGFCTLLIDIYLLLLIDDQSECQWFTTQPTTYSKMISN